MTKAPKSAVPPHALSLDPDIPPDVNGRGTCRCGLLDLPGDPRHTLPTVPEQSVVAGRYEHEDGDER